MSFELQVLCSNYGLYASVLHVHCINYVFVVINIYQRQQDTHTHCTCKHLRPVKQLLKQNQDVAKSEYTNKVSCIY